MPTERILITVRTYPVPSRKYIETVCTGGITDQGEWRRLFPIDLRYLEEERQFQTYDVVQVGVSPGDDRPESRKPNLQTLQKINHLDGWDAKCQWINPTIFPSFEAMIAAGQTLAPVAVEGVKDLLIEKVPPNWSPDQLDRLRQQHLFRENKPLEKVPYKFRFVWTDGEGIEYKNTILAWEIHQTWRKWRWEYDNVIERIRDKWLNDVCSTNNQISFYMGNYAKRRNLFAVTGIFNPPRGVASNDTLW